MSDKDIEAEWLHRGDTNIKYLVDNGCCLWNVYAYRYYRAKMDEYDIVGYVLTFHTFIELIRKGDFRWKKDMTDVDYKLGDVTILSKLHNT